MNKKDAIASLSIGFLVAVLWISISRNIEELRMPYLWALILVLPLLSLTGMFVAVVAGKKFRVLLQGAKFLLVGGLNTFLDLGVLNFLIFATGIAAGTWFSAFKGISFIAAVVNSYAWNKYWTFGTSAQAMQDAAEKRREFLQFFVVSAIGFFLNVGVASLVVNVVKPQLGVAPAAWATVGALAGTIVVLTWNFLGYKLVVFKK